MILVICLASSELTRSILIFICFLHRERFDYVVHFDVLEVGQHYAAVEVLCHFLDVVFAVAQGSDFACILDFSVSDKTCLRSANDFTVTDVATCDSADSAALESFTHFRRTENDLFELGIEHALDRLFDVLDCVVNDVVESDVDFLLRGELFCVVVGAHVEADDDCV